MVNKETPLHPPPTPNSLSLAGTHEAGIRTCKGSAEGSAMGEGEGLVEVGVLLTKGRKK